MLTNEENAYLGCYCAARNFKNVIQMLDREERMLDRKTLCSCVQDTRILLAVPSVGWILLPWQSLCARQCMPELSTVQYSLERQRGQHTPGRTLSYFQSPMFYLTCPFWLSDSHRARLKDSAEDPILSSLWSTVISSDNKPHPRQNLYPCSLGQVLNNLCYGFIITI